MAALNRDALSEINRSIGVHVWAYQGFIAKARMLYFQSRIDFANHDASGAEARFAEALETLRRVPPNSDFGPVAVKMLADFKAPGK